MAVSLVFALAGCHDGTTWTAPSRRAPSPIAPSPTAPSPTAPSPTSPEAQVAITVSSVTKATIGPDKFSYTFKVQLTDTRGVASTATQAEFGFDNGFGAHAELTDDELGRNRRLPANGTLALDLTVIPEWGHSVGNEVFNAQLTVRLTDDHGNEVQAWAPIEGLDKL